ncbi:MAG: hypothetical protein MR469_00890 [Campylobacter sp.]|uniref:hypothetical protein n=1 Tax=Campylobacter sp. TaxID=205 RepID=UPI002AA942A0|nr:hypothetical protein [Campylobacter sp.]MCI6694187.1 hypothetical protein [Campylobacter sp.]
MKINLTEIYKGLDEWRAERKITAESQKDGYIINIMEEFGELASALRDYEKFSATDYPYPTDKQVAEHEIIDALCDIAIFTINAGADIPCRLKDSAIYTSKISFIVANLCNLINDCVKFASDHDYKDGVYYNSILINCAKLCEHCGFNFQIAMDETIKEISSRTGAYDEVSKKWIKDTSDEAKAKWYKADYEKARLYNLGK